MGALRFLDAGDKVEVVIKRVSNSGNGIAPCPLRWASTGELLIEGDVEAGETVTVKITEDGSVAKATVIDARSLPADVEVQSAVEFYERVELAQEERDEAGEEAPREPAARSVPSSENSEPSMDRLTQELRAERMQSNRESKKESDDEEENLNELLQGDM